MNEALKALELVEELGLDSQDALDLVIEGDIDKQAKKMAKKDAPDDKDKQKELECKYKKELEKKMNSGSKKDKLLARFGDKKAAPFKKNGKGDDDE